MIWLGLLATIKAVVAIVLVFLVCVVIHELGHFAVAKRCGVAVPAFAVGFGPKLYKWVRNGTEFSIRLFPLGGMVQLAGEVPQDALFRKGEQIAVKLDSRNFITVLGDPLDIPEGLVGRLVDLDLTNRMTMVLDLGDGPQSFRLASRAKLMTSRRSFLPLVEHHEQVLGKPLWQRAAIILAGPVMNFILAGVLFSIFLMNQGVYSNGTTVGGIAPHSAASRAGLLSGDQIVAVNGQSVTQWDQLVTVIQSDKARPPKPLQITVNRQGQQLSYVVTPILNKTVPQLGIDRSITHNPVLAVSGGFQQVYYLSTNALQMYWGIIHNHNLSSLSGPVGIGEVISQQAQTSAWHVVMIAGLLSLNLGLFNLLPFPALDGGRLLFMVFELVRGKGFDPRKESLVHFVGFALIMLFAVVITYRDVTRLF